MKKLSLLTIVLFLNFGLYAQDGNSYFKDGDYYNASRYYEIEAKTDASKYLNLAKSYFGMKQFDKALKSLESYKREYKGADITLANQLISLLKRDDEEVELRPVKEINTNDHEYSPLISKDGNVLYFVGYDRSGGKGGEDIFYSERKEDGTWGTPKPFDVFNTDSHETLKAISADNNAVILFGNYPGSFGSGDLFYSINVDGSWTFPCNLGGTINTDSWESQANLSSDGRFMLFASKRNGSLGEADIYVSELTDYGWTEPLNLGSAINTSSDERTPFLAADGKTMYFSSDGHLGFGDYDLFVSKRLDESWTNWSKPINMGKYINTLGGDTYFSIPESGTRAYIVGSGGIETNGSDDIFEFILPPSIRPEALFHVYGKVMDEEGEPAAVVIKYFDMEDGKEVAKTISEKDSGAYAVSLPSFRKYQVVIDMKGFLYYTTILDLTDPSKYIKKKSFKEFLGDDYALLTESKYRMKDNTDNFGNLLEAGSDSDMSKNFEGVSGVSNAYSKEAFEIQRIIKEARYAYLSELENQSEVVQDHDVTRIKIGAKFEVKNIFFDFGKATLRTESKAELDKLYDIMNRSEIVIEFGGHSDNVGSDEANLSLSQQRVNSVKEYIVGKGINDARIAAVGYGESQPIADNSTEDGRQKNRRVELQITSLRLEREGADEINANEEYDGLKDESLLAAGSSVQVDLLEKFRKAAKLGGLPSGSDCGNEVAQNVVTPVVKSKKVRNKKSKKVRTKKSRKPWSFLSKKSKTGDVSTTTEPTTTYTPKNNNSTTTTPSYQGGGTTKGSSGGFSSNLSEIDDVDDYIYDHFNPSFRTTGNQWTGTSLGAGFTKVTDDLREFRMHYYFDNDQNMGSSVKWTADLEWLFAIKLGIPLNLHYGIETTMQIVDESFNPDGGTLWLNVPVGLRYTFDLGDLKIAPEFFYSFQALSSNTIQDFYGKSTYRRIGVNARWKFIQGGIFSNRGDYVKYTGLRIGFAF